jgi:hypothetical protein
VGKYRFELMLMIDMLALLVFCVCYNPVTADILVGLMLLNAI